jgi:membrane glycosyltransferase
VSYTVLNPSPLGMAGLHPVETHQAKTCIVACLSAPIFFFLCSILCNLP